MKSSVWQVLGEITNYCVWYVVYSNCILIQLPKKYAMAMVVLRVVRNE